MDPDGLSFSAPASPAAEEQAPAPAPRLRRCLSFRPRHLEATKQPSDVDPTVRHAAVGIGLAMRALLYHYRELGTRPMVLNERTVPLHDASTAAASFVWTDEIEGLDVPHLHAVRLPAHMRPADIMQARRAAPRTDKMGRRACVRSASTSSSRSPPP